MDDCSSDMHTPSPTERPICTRTRTAGSIIWKNTKAKHLTSSVRFVWDKSQKILFEDFLRTAGLGFKNADISPLLYELNLDGYEGVINVNGQNVHSLIEEKVRRKLRTTADGMGEDALREVSLGPKKTTRGSTGTGNRGNRAGRPLSPATQRPTARATSSTEPTPNSRSNVVPPQQSGGARVKEETPMRSPKPGVDTSRDRTRLTRDTTVDKAMSPQSFHPRLKMPQQVTPPMSPANSRGDTKRESETPPPFFFGAHRRSSTRQSVLPGQIEHEQVVPSFEFKSVPTPRSSRASSPASGTANTVNSSDYNPARGAVRRFASRVSSLDTDLRDVKSALDELSLEKGDKADFADIIDDLSTNIQTIENQSDFLGELTTTLLVE
ncbi:hypothetical protein AAE478_006800 [Parahypoxylon ruwenzoriense]